MIRSDIELSYLSFMVFRAIPVCSFKLLPLLHNFIREKLTRGYATCVAHKCCRVPKNIVNSLNLLRKLKNERVEKSGADIMFTLFRGKKCNAKRFLRLSIEKILILKGRRPPNFLCNFV